MSSPYILLLYVLLLYPNLWNAGCIQQACNHVNITKLFDTFEDATLMQKVS